MCQFDGVRLVKNFTNRGNTTGVKVVYCTCSNCRSARTTYGGQSGVTLKFLNDIVAILDSDAEFKAQYPDYKIYTFAYQYSFAYPTVSNTVIKACDKVAVMLCPSATDARYDLLNTTYNSESANALNGWHNYCADLMIWMYDANFTNYVEYHPTLSGVIAHNVYKLRNLGVSYIMVNGAYNADGMWDDKIRAYVYSELFYDFDEAKYKAGADAYVNEIVAKYLAAYYGEYADEVQGIITALQTALSQYKLAGNTSNASKIDIGIIQDQISVIEAAISANNDATLEKRLYAVNASLLATLYENSKPVIASQWGYKSEFKTVCNSAGITMWNETQTITDKFGS